MLQCFSGSNNPNVGVSQGRIMIWLFLAVVLILLVLHPGFRRVMGWSVAAVAAVAAIAAGAYWFHNRSTAPISAYSPNQHADCPVGTKLAKHPRSGVEACYTPQALMIASMSQAQLAQHLKECGLPPLDAPANAPLPKHIPATDSRGIPCNAFDQFDNDCPAPPAPPWPGCVTR
jgi:hypothetical protein